MTQQHDLQTVRSLFPAVEKMTYLDSGFQAPMSQPVKHAFETFISESYESAGPKSIWIARMEETEVTMLISPSTTLAELVLRF